MIYLFLLVRGLIGGVYHKSLNHNSQDYPDYLIPLILSIMLIRKIRGQTFLIVRTMIHRIILIS